MSDTHCCVCGKPASHVCEDPACEAAVSVLAEQREFEQWDCECDGCDLEVCDPSICSVQSIDSILADCPF